MNEFDRFDTATASNAFDQFDASTPLDPLGVKQSGADAMTAAANPSVLERFRRLAATPSPEWMQPAEKFIRTPLVSPDTIAPFLQADRGLPNLQALRQGKVETPSEPPVIASPVGQGIAQGVGEAASQFTSPGNLALLPLIPEGAVGKVVAGGFTAQGLAQYPELYRRFQATDDPQEKARILATAAVLAAPAAGLLQGGVRGTTPKPENLPSDKIPVSSDIPKALPQPNVPEGYARFQEPQVTEVPPSTPEILRQNQPLAASGQAAAIPTAEQRGAELRTGQPQQTIEPPLIETGQPLSDIEAATNPQPESTQTAAGTQEAQPTIADVRGVVRYRKEGDTWISVRSNIPITDPDVAARLDQEFLAKQKEGETNAIEKGNEPESNQPEYTGNAPRGTQPSSERGRSDESETAKQEETLDPSGRVKSGVFGSSHEDEVFNSVVSSIPIDVVNKLGGKKVAANVLLHDQPMLENLLSSAKSDADVSAFSDSIMSGAARLRTKPLGTESMRGRIELLPTLDALNQRIAEVRRLRSSVTSPTTIRPSTTGATAKDVEPTSAGATGERLGNQPEIVPQTSSSVNPEPPRTTGVANRVLQTESDAGRFEEVQPGEGMSAEEMIDLGRQELNRGVDPQVIANRFKRTKEISPKGFAVLRAQRENLFAESNRLEDAYKANPTPQAKAAFEAARKAESDWVRNVVQPAKTKVSDIFRGMQQEVPVDVATFAGLRRAVEDLHGEPVKPEQAPRLRQAAKRVQDATAAETRALQKLAGATERGRKTKARSVDELRDHFAERIKQITPC